MLALNLSTLLLLQVTTSGVVVVLCICADTDVHNADKQISISVSSGRLSSFNSVPLQIMPTCAVSGRGSGLTDQGCSAIHSRSPERACEVCLCLLIPPRRCRIPCERSQACQSESASHVSPSGAARREVSVPSRPVPSLSPIPISLRSTALAFGSSDRCQLFRPSSAKFGLVDATGTERIRVASRYKRLECGQSGTACKQRSN